MNLWTWQLNRDYATTFEGFGRPWSHLERLAGPVDVEDVFFGGGYIATARLGRPLAAASASGARADAVAAARAGPRAR